MDNRSLNPTLLEVTRNRFHIPQTQFTTDLIRGDQCISGIEGYECLLYSTTTILRVC